MLRAAVGLIMPSITEIAKANALKDKLFGHAYRELSVGKLIAHLTYYIKRLEMHLVHWRGKYKAWNEEKSMISGKTM